MRRGILAVLVVVLAAGGAGSWVLAADTTATPTDEATAAPLATATIARQDLVEAEELAGTLGYGTSRTLAAGAGGVVTGVPAVEDVLGPGEVLFEVDAEPVVLLAGTVPAYRDLSSGVADGQDVAQVEAALSALGYATDLDLTVDTDYTSVTALAVEAWEEALGRADPDGEVLLGDVVFGSDAVRVAAVESVVGTTVQSGTAVLEVTGTRKVVTVDLDAGDVDLLPVGTAVTVELPDGTDAPATVESVGVDVEVAATDDDGEATDGESTVPVVITLDDPALAADLDEADVTVVVETDRRDGVVVAPVEALLALAEGGYAVEVVEGSATRLVGVQVGEVSDGVVEVTGEGIEPGVEVVVP